MKDVLGQAMTDYYHQVRGGKLWVRRDGPDGPREEMPVDVYFRTIDEMPELEWVALQQCRGSILDIGAGAGSHVLALQQMGQEVTALEISPLSSAVMKERGIRQVLTQDFFGLAGQQQYDTLLMMMNGIGLAGTLDGLRRFLRKARRQLRPGGQLVFDSSDIAYLYEGMPPEGPDYYGALFYQYEYRRMQSGWFNWLFVDRKTLADIVAAEGWQMQVLFEDDSDQFLVSCR